MFKICKKKSIFLVTALFACIVFFNDMVAAASPFSATVHNDVHGRKYIELIVDDVIQANSFDKAKATIEGLRGQGLPIIIQINSPGGDVGGLFNILQTIRNWDAPIISVNNGIAYSAGAILYIVGDIRVARANSDTMFHGVQIQTPEPLNVSSIKKLYKYMKELNAKMYKLATEETGQSEANIRATWFDEEREDNFLSTADLRKFGIVNYTFNEFFDRMQSEGINSIINSNNRQMGMFDSIRIGLQGILKTMEWGLASLGDLLSYSGLTSTSEV